jgi:hypothetical protein
LRLSYDASHIISPTDLPKDIPDWIHSVRAIYETPCRCAGVLLSADFPLRGGTILRAPTIRFVLDLKSLGSFATF